MTDAAKALGLGAALQLVEPHRYQAILGRIIESRTTLSKHAMSAAWWWEALRPPAVACQPADALAVLPRLLPEGGRLWFLVEADEVPAKREGSVWLYDAEPRAITQVLRALPYCEYCVVGRKCDWLLGENHHGTLMANGALMTDRMSRLDGIDARLVKP